MKLRTECTDIHVYVHMTMTHQPAGKNPPHSQTLRHKDRNALPSCAAPAKKFSQSSVTTYWPDKVEVSDDMVSSARAPEADG